MRGGALRKRLDVQVCDKSQKDAHGNPIAKWTVEQTRWGKIEPVDGTEVPVGEAQATRLTHKITIRFYKNISPLNRISYSPPGATSARIFEIKSVVNVDERSVQQVLMCTEGSPNG